jgi:hypothetical protein
MDKRLIGHGSHEVAAAEPGWLAIERVAQLARIIHEGCERATFEVVFEG